jgi:dihydrofolate reductase/thymidylate synthase
MINLIVAVDNDWGFSKDNKIPFPTASTCKAVYDDMIHFYKTTTENSESNSNLSNIVIMGKNTWESIPEKNKPLKNRINVIVSTTLFKTNVSTHNVIFTNSVESAFHFAIRKYIYKEVEKVFVIGGLSLYNYALNSVLLNKVYVTKFNKSFNCDLFFNKNLLFKKCYNLMEQQTEFICESTCNSSNELSSINYVFESKKQFEGEQQYLNILWSVLTTGHFRETRNAFTYSKFSTQMTFDLEKGFPLITTRKSFLKGIFYELKMFLLGESNTKKWLLDNGTKIWAGNTNRQFLDTRNLSHYPEHDLGYLYGVVWKHYGIEYKSMNEDYTGQGYDQIEYVLNLLKTDQTNRRILITSYDPSKADTHAPLYPCHSIVLQFYVEEGNRLSLMMVQRSCDLLLGAHYNIPSTSLLLILFTIVVNSDPEYKGPKLIPGKVTINLGDYHIYDSHMEQVMELLSRNPLSFPQLKINRETTNFADFEFSDLELINYDHYPPIKADMVA